MITCPLRGGLGNKMFQIAKALSIAMETDQECAFDLHDTVVHQGEPAYKYKDTVFSKVKELLEGDEPIIYDKGDSYWQSEKHFWNIRQFIVDYFSDINTLVRLHKKYKTLLKNSVSIHVRRGDYLQTGDVLPQEYYYKALNKLWEMTDTEHFLVFSDDIEWCKTNFLYNTRYIYYVEGLRDDEELYLMSLCTNNITANSSFSWWGAYLNRNPNKIVIMPKPWTASHDDDIYPKGTIIVNR